MTVLPATDPSRRLVLINGVYGAPEHFDSLRQAFEGRAATEVFTLRRDGLPLPTAATAFAPMVERLDPVIARDPARRPALLGFSLGGALALEYALRHPGRLSALILVNAFARFEGDPLQVGSIPALQWLPGTQAHPALMARVVRRVTWVRRGIFHEDAPLAVIERTFRVSLTAMTHDDVRFQLAHLLMPLPREMPARLGALARQLPVLLISSRDDLIVPPRHTDRLAAWMPAARRLPAVAGGHAFFQHDASALAGMVNAFLSEVDPPQAGRP